MKGERGGGQDVMGESKPSRLHEYKSRHHVLTQKQTGSFTKAKCGLRVIGQIEAGRQDDKKKLLLFCLSNTVLDCADINC